MFRTTLLAAAAALFTLSALAPAQAHDGIHIENAYARIGASGSGAVFFDIVNHSAEADRLIAAATDAAERVELHTHLQDAQGVMRMVEVKDGLPVEGGQTLALMRGGDHVMLMGVRQPLKDGDVFALTLTFERGDVLTIEVPVDNARMPPPAAHGGHGHGHGHGAPSN